MFLLYCNAYLPERLINSLTLLLILNTNKEEKHGQRWSGLGTDLYQEGLGFKFGWLPFLAFLYVLRRRKVTMESHILPHTNTLYSVMGLDPTRLK